MISLSEKVVLVLEFSHYPAIFQLDCSMIAIVEFISQIWGVPILDNLAPLRERSIQSGRFSEIVIHRTDECRVVDVQDCAESIKELPPGLELIRTMPELILQRGSCTPLRDHSQLADVRGSRIDRGTDQLTLIHIPAPGREVRRVSVEHLIRSLIFFLDPRPVLEYHIKKSHVIPRSLIVLRSPNTTSA